MTKSAKKAMIIGLDAPIVERVYDYAVNGKLPNFQKCIENGAWAKNGMNPLPTVTPPNWTTLATGAWPATNEITCFNVHRPGDPLDITYSGMNGAFCHAEHIWTAVEKAGKKSIILNWPSSWPPTIKEGWQVAGAGVSPNEFFAAPGSTPGRHIALSSPTLIATKPYPLAQQAEFAPAEGWQNAPAAHQAFQMTASPKLRSAMYRTQSPTWQILALDTEGKGFDRVIVAESKDAARPIASLKVGEWSPLIRREFQTDKGPKVGAFRIKLLALSPDAKDFRLLVTTVGALEGYTYPDPLAAELAELDVLPQPTPEMRRLQQAGWYDVETYVELCEMNNAWLTEVGSYLLKNKPWDLFAMHNHLPDMTHHLISNWMDPQFSDPETVKRFQAVELKIYRLIDSMVGRFLEYADEDTVVVFVSDHGAKPSGDKFSTNRVLEKAGLLKWAPVEDPAKLAAVEQARNEEIGMTRNAAAPSLVDWTQTKAFAQRSVYVYVNLKGRDPDGIVDPADYEKTQEEIIDALLSHKDPKTGRRPIVFALKKEDARFTGHWGPYVGDVVYAIDPGYKDQHAYHLPTARYGQTGSIRSLFLITGPGVRKGEILERNVWSQDVVPTICYLTGWPVPTQAEGAVVYQALEDPNR